MTEKDFRLCQFQAFSVMSGCAHPIWYAVDQTQLEMCQMVSLSDCDGTQSLSERLNYRSGICTHTAGSCVAFTEFVSEKKRRDYSKLFTVDVKGTWLSFCFAGINPEYTLAIMFYILLECFSFAFFFFSFSPRKVHIVFLISVFGSFWTTQSSQCKWCLRLLIKDFVVFSPFLKKNILLYSWLCIWCWSDSNRVLPFTTWLFCSTNSFISLHCGHFLTCDDMFSCASWPNPSCRCPTSQGCLVRGACLRLCYLEFDLFGVLLYV